MLQRMFIDCMFEEIPAVKVGGVKRLPKQSHSICKENDLKENLSVSCDIQLRFNGFYLRLMSTSSNDVPHATLHHSRTCHAMCSGSEADFLLA